jgi:hypothetical protein
MGRTVLFDDVQHNFRIKHLTVCFLMLWVSAFLRRAHF